MKHKCLLVQTVLLASLQLGVRTVWHLSLFSWKCLKHNAEVRVCVCLDCRVWKAPTTIQCLLNTHPFSEVRILVSPFLLSAINIFIYLFIFPRNLAAHSDEKFTATSRGLPGIRVLPSAPRQVHSVSGWTVVAGLKNMFSTKKRGSASTGACRDVVFLENV